MDMGGEVDMKTKSHACWLRWSVRHGQVWQLEKSDGDVNP